MVLDDAFYWKVFRSTNFQWRMREKEPKEQQQGRESWSGAAMNSVRWALIFDELLHWKSSITIEQTYPLAVERIKLKEECCFSKQCLALSGTQWVLIQWILFRFRISLSTIFHDVRLTLQDALWNIIAVATQCHDGVAIRSDIIWSASSGCCYPAVAYRIPMMLLIRELLFRNSRNRFGKSKKFEMRSFAH